MRVLSDRSEILRACRELFAPGQVAEVRALGCVRSGWRRPHTVAGYFTDWELLVSAAAGLEAAGVYVTLNPVLPALLARAANHLIDVGAGNSLAGDADIVARRWLPVDCDAVRPAGISATDEEHRLALDRARDIREHLAGRGGPRPVRGFGQREPFAVPGRAARGRREQRAAGGLPGGPGGPVHRRAGDRRPDGVQPGAHLEVVWDGRSQGGSHRGAAPPGGAHHRCGRGAVGRGAVWRGGAGAAGRDPGAARGAGRGGRAARDPRKTGAARDSGGAARGGGAGRRELLDRPLAGEIPRAGGPAAAVGERGGTALGIRGVPVEPGAPRERVHRGTIGRRGWLRDAITILAGGRIGAACERCSRGTRRPRLLHAPGSARTLSRGRGRRRTWSMGAGRGAWGGA